MQLKALAQQFNRAKLIGVAASKLPSKKVSMAYSQNIMYLEELWVGLFQEWFLDGK